MEKNNLNILTYLQIKFESSLYPTALIHIQIRIYPRIWNRIRKYMYYGVNQRLIWGRFMKKTRGRQSRATVPLSISITFIFLYCIFTISLRQSRRTVPLMRIFSLLPILKSGNICLEGGGGDLVKAKRVCEKYIDIGI